jgi:hypothetical protein
MHRTTFFGHRTRDRRGSPGDYVWQDDSGEGTAESWVSSSVPGSIVKSVYSRSKGKRTSTVELIQIESGVTTVLGSF